jgi:hypothetical protein
MSNRSWAISRTCCDIYPLHGEARVMADPNYILKNTFHKQNFVYVFIQDLPLFINLVFIHLPMDHQITLVTGMDDFGAPFEIFSPKGRFKVKPPIDMRQVILFLTFEVVVVVIGVVIVVVACSNSGGSDNRRNGE